MNPDEDRTELADLDGLVGTTRAELAWTHDIAALGTTQNFYARVAGSAPTFKYMTVPGLIPAQVRKPGFGAGAGLVFKIGTTFLLRGGGKFERSYVAQDPQSLCTPANVGVPDAVTCASTIIGAPTRQTKHVGEVELRAILGDYTAVSIGVVHDFKSRVTGINVPLWLIPDIAGTFGGGVRVGYRSKGDKRWTLSVFVGQFKL